MKPIHTNNAPAAIGPYSQGMRIDSLLFLSGQIGFVPSTGALAGDTVNAQAKQICENIRALLAAETLSMDHVVKTTCFLTDMADFSSFNEIYSTYFTSKPARSCVAVKALPGNALCEIEVIASYE